MPCSVVHDGSRPFVVAEQHPASVWLNRPGGALATAGAGCGNAYTGRCSDCTGGGREGRPAASAWNGHVHRDRCYGGSAAGQRNHGSSRRRCRIQGHRTGRGRSPETTPGRCGPYLKAAVELQ